MSPVSLPADAKLLAEVTQALGLNPNGLLSVQIHFEPRSLVKVHAVYAAPRAAIEALAGRNAAGVAA